MRETSTERPPIWAIILAVALIPVMIIGFVAGVLWCGLGVGWDGALHGLAHATEKK